MSIIYDALKKVEEKYDKNVLPEPNKARQPSSMRRSILVFILLISALLFIGNNFLGNISRRRGALPVAAKQESAQAAMKAQIKSAPEIPKEAILKAESLAVASQTQSDSKAGFVLSGVFFAQNEGFALINNQIVKKGSVIDGAVVKKISLDEVELENGGTTVKLTSAVK